ncbi:MAG: hypothetical protein LLG05_08525 [Porphyromonadaceae bacterium]|nr:hypothetical protein [Porphyromonadaceae bacterium]
MKVKYKNHLLSLVWLLLLILPTSQFFYLFVPVSFILLYDSKKTIRLSVLYVIGILILLMITSFIINVNEYYVSFKDILRVLALIILFITFGRLKGNIILASYIVIAILFIVASQLLYALGIPFVNTVINNYYLPSEDLQNLYEFSMSDFGQIRLGGIYGNANNYASFIELMLVVLIIEKEQFKKKYFYSLFGLIIYSIIATGSRTSLIVLVVIIMHYIYIYNRKSFKSFTLSIAVLLIITLIISQYIDFSSLRVFRIEEGMNDSFGYKVELLRKYLNQNLPLSRILFGSFSGSVMTKYSISTYKGTDFEIGDTILMFGFIFFIALFVFYNKIFKYLLPQYRILYTILLWIFSNSILLSYRMSSVWLMVLGLYYYRSSKRKIIQADKTK